MPPSPQLKRRGLRAGDRGRVFGIPPGTDGPFRVIAGLRIGGASPDPAGAAVMGGVSGPRGWPATAFNVARRPPGSSPPLALPLTGGSGLAAGGRIADPFPATSSHA